MKRREFFAGVGGAALWPVCGPAQGSLPVVGVLEAADQGDDGFSAVRQGLSDVGYVHGRNVAIEYRSAQAKYDLSRRTRRREFIRLPGGAAVDWPLIVYAQRRSGL